MAQGQPRMAQPQMAAKGGRIGKQEGGLMDMGGMEKDYRNEGGFVPIGGKEKADDVPARLSKNEFVFTADAVRACWWWRHRCRRRSNGKRNEKFRSRAERFQKNLKALKAMYNNMKQLETRIA